MDAPIMECHGNERQQKGKFPLPNTGGIGEKYEQLDHNLMYHRK
jgi:hypothetical protein